MTKVETMFEMQPDSRTVRKTVIFLTVAGAILWMPVVLLLLGRDDVKFLRDLGFVSGPRGTLLGWILAIIVAILYAGYAVKNIPFVAKYWRTLSAIKVLSVVLAIAAAIVEEAFFRRLIMDAVMVAGGSAIVQVFASALAFGLGHALWGIMTGRIMIGVTTVIATGTLGAALALVYVISDRSLAPPIVSHFLVTAVIQPGILFAAFSGQMRKPPMAQ
jgi:membrane protease YdiL (CAAX protease family)